MAPGVAKTFIKELYKVMCIRYPECSNNESSVDKYNQYLDNEGIKRELKKYREEHRLILGRLDEIKDIIKARYCKTLTNNEIQSLIDVALKYTEDATHQAMEAVVHNLNSMHSRAGKVTACPNHGKPWVVAV